MKNLRTFEEFVNESYIGPVGVEMKNYKYSGHVDTISVKLNNKEYRLRMELKFPRQVSKEDIKTFESLEKELKRLKFPTKVEYSENLEWSKQNLILDGYYDVYHNMKGYTLIQTVGKNTLEFFVYSFVLKNGKVTHSNELPD